MKKLKISILFLTFFAFTLSGQPKKSIDGIWLGTLKINAMQEVELRIGFTFSQSATGNLGALMKSIDQDQKIWETEFSQGTVTAPLLFNKVDRLPE